MGLAGIVSIFSAFIYSTIKTKQHELLCAEFVDQFGYLPGDITIYRSGGLFFTFQKDIYFFLALSFPKGSFFVKNIDTNLYDFIRKQPENKTSWIQIKFFLLFSGLISLTVGFLINAYIN